MKKILFLTSLANALIGAAILSASAAWAGEGQFSLSSGFGLSPGKFATANTTDILSIPVTGKYETGPWIFKLTVPNPGVVGMSGTAPGIGHITGSTANSALSGLNDTVAAATYNLYPSNVSSFGLDLTGKVKIGLADKIQGFGTAQNDYAAQADAYQSFDKFTALGSLGYKFLGSPAGISTDTLLYGSLGGVYQLNDQISGGVDLSLAQSTSISTADQRLLTAYINHMINKNLNARGYVLRGFTSGSPDTGLGARVYYGF